MTFEELDLDPKLLQATQDAGFTACTPVQEQTFVYSLIGADVAVQSQTGTGKTAAFLITIFQLFLEQRSLDDSIALIVAPTRELADQIEMDALQLGKHLDFSIASFYGGVGYEKQERALAGALRVAIGTPGRLLDFAKQRKLDLSRVGILVIDEADRLFDMGFIPDLRRSDPADADTRRAHYHALQRHPDHAREVAGVGVHAESRRNLHHPRTGHGG